MFCSVKWILLLECKVKLYFWGRFNGCGCIWLRLALSPAVHSPANDILRSVCSSAYENLNNLTTFALFGFSRTEFILLLVTVNVRLVFVNDKRWMEFSLFEVSSVSAEYPPFQRSSYQMPNCDLFVFGLDLVSSYLMLYALWQCCSSWLVVYLVIRRLSSIFPLSLSIVSFVLLSLNYFLDCCIMLSWENCPFSLLSYIEYSVSFSALFHYVVWCFNYRDSVSFLLLPVFCWGGHWVPLYWGLFSECFVLDKILCDGVLASVRG